MSQVNIKKTVSFQNPSSGMLGYGFDEFNNPVRVNADASTTILGIEAENTPNIIANKGVGLEADLPITFVQGDIYVTNDTYKKYTAVDAITWSSIDLIETQFITDVLTKPILFQYNGNVLIIIVRTPTNVNVADMAAFNLLVANTDYFVGDEITITNNGYEEIEIWKYMYDMTANDYELKLRSRMAIL